MDIETRAGTFQVDVLTPSTCTWAEDLRSQLAHTANPERRPTMNGSSLGRGWSSHGRDQRESSPPLEQRVLRDMTRELQQSFGNHF